MPSAPLPANETERLQALYRYDILDTEIEPAYDEIAEIAAYICQTPAALISLVDKDRQWFKSTVGVSIRETPREVAFCAHAIHQQDQLLVVDDATQDQRFADNPLVIYDPKLRFYAGAPLNTPDGYCLGTLCVVDYQPRHLSPEQLRALNALSHQVITQMELRVSLRRLKNYARDLQKLNESKNRFFATLAHDLRTPCGGILGLAEILKDETENLSISEIKEYAGDIFTTASEAHCLMNNLLEWSRFETGAMSYKPDRVSIYELVMKIVSLLRSVAEHKQIDLVVLGQETLWVVADRQMLFSVLQNLVANALKFTPSGGRITLHWSIVGNAVQIQVSDTGVGMNPEQLAKLQHDRGLDSTKGTAGEVGTGLGLLLCHQFIEKHGGRLEVNSQKGVGTTFTITLPHICQEVEMASVSLPAAS
jgi:signal transduction histidine kinase